MAKLALFPVLLIAACLTAGIYGALHNQISYTVSPDYFHAFKFHQFGIPKDLQGRIGASIVGWHASWWMGHGNREEEPINVNRTLDGFAPWPAPPVSL